MMIIMFKKSAAKGFFICARTARAPKKKKEKNYIYIHVEMNVVRQK